MQPNSAHRKDGEGRWRNSRGSDCAIRKMVPEVRLARARSHLGSVAALVATDPGKHRSRLVLRCGSTGQDRERSRTLRERRTSVGGRLQLTAGRFGQVLKCPRIWYSVTFAPQPHPQSIRGPRGLTMRFAVGSSFHASTRTRIAHLRHSPDRQRSQYGLTGFSLLPAVE